MHRPGGPSMDLLTTWMPSDRKGQDRWMSDNIMSYNFSDYHCRKLKTEDLRVRDMKVPLCRTSLLAQNGFYHKLAEIPTC